MYAEVSEKNLREKGVWAYWGPAQILARAQLAGKARLKFPFARFVQVGCIRRCWAHSGFEVIEIGVAKLWGDSVLAVPSWTDADAVVGMFQSQSDLIVRRTSSRRRSKEETQLSTG